MNKIPRKYLPKTLSKKDKIKQRNNIIQSRELYRKGIYLNRPIIKSAKNKKSTHIKSAKKYYNISSIIPSRELSHKTKCNIKSLQKIVNKGQGAYYSSGSRPNQTAQSWGIARLASAITGGPASKIDHSILEEGCAKNSPAIKMSQHK